MYDAPPSVNLIPCKEQCGAMFCSETCRDIFNAYGHHIACPNIKHAKEEERRKIEKMERQRMGDCSCCSNDNESDNVRTRASLTEEKERKLRAELIETRDTDLDFAKLELMVCHDYELEEVDEMHEREIPSILARARVEEWYEEEQKKIRMSQESSLQMTYEEAGDMMRRNIRLPAVIHKGTGLHRRFRPGQRVILGKGWAGNNTESDITGTVIRLLVHGDGYESSSPYEIETDEGVYLCVPEDMDQHIQYEEGGCILGDEIIADVDLLHDVQREVEMGYSSCNALRQLLFGEHGATTDASCPSHPYSSKLNRRHCHCCGKKVKSSKSKSSSSSRAEDKKKESMAVCTGCRCVAYCSRECQIKHWPEHKPACRAVQEARQDFLDRNPDAEHTKEGRRFIRTQSIMTHRYYTLGTFFEQKCGMSSGTARLLQGFVMRSVETTLLADIFEDEFVDGEGNHYNGRDESLQSLARDVLEEDAFFTMSGVNAGGGTLLTTQNLFRLVAGVVHFCDTDRDLAAFCVTALDVFLHSSFNRAIVPDVKGIQRFPM